MNLNMITQLGKMSLLILAWVGFATVSSGQVVTCTNSGVPVTINTGADAWNGEVGWELYNATTGEIVAYEQTGGVLDENVSVTFDAPQGNYELYGYDTFGDNWSGFDIEIVSNGQLVCSGDDVSGGSGNGGNNATAICGGGTNGGTLLCAQFFVGQAACTIDCPPDTTVFSDPGECGAFVSIPSPDLSALCEGDAVNDYNGTADASDFYPVGTTVVTFSASDTSGAPADCSFAVTVTDAEEPTFANCPNDLTINLDAGECDQVYSFQLEVEDNCPPSASSIQGPYCDPCQDPSGASALACAPFAENSIIQFIDLPGDGEIEFLTFNQETFGDEPLATFNIYAQQPGGVIPYTGGGFTPLGSVQYQTDAADDGECVEVDFPNPVTIPAGGVWLEVYTPGNTVNSRIVQTPETCDGNAGTGNLTYINAPACDFNPPVTFASQGFTLDAGFTLGYNPGELEAEPDANPTNPDANQFASGDILPIGEHCFEYEAEDAAGNIATCEWCVTVAEFPNPVQNLSCNDLVNVTVDEECGAIVTADMVLEGGPYGCYRDYIVEIANDMAFNDIISSSQPGDEGAVIGSAEVGGSFFVRVIDPETGNSCWGRLVVEDKLIPELECSRFPADCGADITPGAGGSSSLVLDDANGEIVIDPLAPGDYPATAEANGIVGDAQITNVSVRLVTDHSWVGDLSGNIESPSGTVVNLFPQPGGGGCGGDGLDVLFDDAAPNTNADFVNTCNNNPAIEGEYQPLDPLSVLNGENPAGEWTISINDAAFFDGGEFSVAEFIIEYNFSIPFPFDFTGTPILIAENTYLVSGFDPCGDVTASYEDEIVEISDCDSDFSSRVFRNWTVVDGSGNTTTCQDTIEVLRSSLEDITFPPNFDGNDQPALACDGENWDLNGNGYPDPEETGAPDAQICDNLLTTSKDHVIEVCEGTFKILRDWTFIDWCTSETVEFQQLIKVEDTEGPEVVCPPTATISTGANSCIATYSVPDITGNIIDECSPSDVSWTVESSAGEVVDFGNQVFQIIDLPIGTHTLTYTAFDGCGNEGSCNQTIIVRDEIPPVAVCDQNTKVALGVDGTARVFWPTFEDGSYDNCGIDQIQVRRMDRESDCEPNTFFFKEFVEFCCADLDRNPVQVLFRVTDEAGNQNTCMINVTVEDKLPPAIVAPRDLTLSCNYPFDLWNLEEFGEVANLTAGEVRQTRRVFDEEYERNCLNNNPYDPEVPTYEFLDGFAQDNCSLEISSDYNDQRDDCGIGTLIRTFRAVDADGNANVAFQSIEFERCTPFTENSITWPLDQELACDENGDYSTDPEATGEPEFDDVCSQIAVRFDDEVFEVTPDACFKILRHWTVLDWCQFDEETGAGKFTYTQVIKVNDSQAPELLACEDVTFCDSSAVGCTGFANLVQEVEDCTPDSFLNVSWRVKPFNAGNNPNDDIVGSGLDASGFYPFGTHRITWIVEDMCGNVGTCQYLFTVEDCKLPTPVVINGLATVVMPSSGCIDVNVDLFDAGSFDNCGPVQFSYSADVDDTIATFCCEDGLGTKEVEFWATDAVGNQDFVITSIRIQDPNGFCGDPSQPTISGTVESSAQPGKGVERAEMKLENMSAPTPLFRQTSADGEYAFYAAEGESYSLNATKNDDVLNGVSTFDILMIQRHILGIEILSDPYQLIAANVNDDGRVSGADIIELRKVILGIEKSFPNNQSWRFVDAAETLEEGQLPRQYKESIAIYDLDEDLTDQDFVGVKIGDINGNAKPNNFTSQDAEGRNGALVWEAEEAILESGQTHDLMITSAMFDNVSGYQMTWNTHGVDIEEVISGSVRVESSNYAVFDDYMTMSWNNAEGLSTDDNEALFIVRITATEDVRLSDALSISSEITPAEAYVGEDIQKVDLRFNSAGPREFALYQNVPNPFESKTIIRFDLPEAGNATLTVFDGTGKVVKEINGDYKAGSNQLELLRSDLPGHGLLYYRLESGDYVAVKKMILME